LSDGLGVLAFDGDGLQPLDGRGRAVVDAALQVHWIHPGGYGFHAFA
jgi:hypothetical protein